MAETCHEVGYTSVGTFSRRFLRDVGTPPGALRRIADRVAERTQPAVSLLVPAVARIRIRPEVPEEMRRTLGPAPLSVDRDLSPPRPQRVAGHRDAASRIDEVELPVVPGSPWILATIFPDGADVHEQLAPTRPLVARLRVPEEPVVGPSPCRCAQPFPGIRRSSWPGGDGGVTVVLGPVGQDSRIGVVRGVPVGLPSRNVRTSLDMQPDT